MPRGIVFDDGYFTDFGTILEGKMAQRRPKRGHLGPQDGAAKPDTPHHVCVLAPKSSQDPPRGISEISWRRLGRQLRSLGALLAALGRSWDPLGTLLAALGSLLGASWDAELEMSACVPPLRSLLGLS